MEQTIRNMLENNFAPEFVKKRQGYEYLEVHAVIQRLNDALGSDNWQFELEERMVDAEEIVQFGRIGVRSESGEWVWKSQCGAKKVSYLTETVNGKKVAGPHTADNRMDYGNDFKAAASDCLKKCATLFGVGLYLYGEVEEDPLSSVMASIQKGEDELSNKLQCSEADLRNEHFGVDNDVLEAKTLEVLEGYLAHLRSVRDADQPEQPPEEQQEQPAGDKSPHLPSSGDVAQLKVQASQLQAKSLLENLIPKSDLDAKRRDLFGKLSYPEDAGLLAEYIEWMDKAITNAGATTGTE